MRIKRKRSLRLGVALTLSALVVLTTLTSAASGKAQHVRWDIVHLAFTTPTPTVSAGGHAEAKTPAPESATIRLTGTGTFVAPSSGRGSGAATGGGTWSVTGGAGGSGTYVVTGLVSWEFANLQTPGSLIDLIGNQLQRANGTAVLRVKFSDGQSGILTVGCHGPGAPDGIFEGIATTKGFKTYYDVQGPAPGVDANRTIFHVLK